MASVYRKFTGLFPSAFFVPLVPCGIAHMARFTKGKGWRVIAFLRVPVAMDVAMDILPLEKILGGVSKCPRNICAETAVIRTAGRPSGPCAPRAALLHVLCTCTRCHLLPLSYNSRAGCSAIATQPHAYWH